MGGVNQDEGKKVLVIRFSAIGDVVLTSPIIRALKLAGFQVDYVVKEKFKNAWQWAFKKVVPRAAIRSMAGVGTALV